MSRLKAFTELGAAVSIVVLFACSGESLRNSRNPDTMIGSPSQKSAATSRRSTDVSATTALPPGVKFHSGATIPNSDYVFRRVETSRGEMVWLDSVTQSTSGSASRQLLTELRLPPLAPDERVMLASCDVGGRLDAFVVAIVVNEENVTRFTKVLQAWRADPHTRRFEILPVGGIVCEDPGT